ncbi:hypothetical protein DXA57_04275 [Blautia sp. OF03-15BH]|nr:hypothetical protein DXA57_04275 [Blautia sp. OF03-15BH]
MSVCIIVIVGVYLFFFVKFLFDFVLEIAEDYKIQDIHKKIDEQGLDKTVIELYTGYDSIDDIEDYVDLPREEIIKILRTNNKL